MEPLLFRMVGRLWNLKKEIKMSKKKQILTLAFLAVTGFGLSACQTVDGAGRDIEKAGESIQDSSN